MHVHNPRKRDRKTLGQHTLSQVEPTTVNALNFNVENEESKETPRIAAEQEPSPTNTLAVQSINSIVDFVVRSTRIEFSDL